MTLSLLHAVIYIYNDEGTWPADIGFITQAIKFSCPQYEVSCIDAKGILAGMLNSTVDCLIMPGGADIPYHQALGQVGMDLIKAYVKNGGKYLGLCAGGYFGSEHEIFNSGPPPIIETGLGFFDGCDEGPFYPPYDGTDKTARMIGLNFFGYLVPVYYNGGGQFVSGTNPSLTRTVASYTDSKKSRAIVQCAYGQGLAVLTGVHPELCYEQCLAHLTEDGRKTYKQQLNMLRDLEQRYGKYDLFRQLLAAVELQTVFPGVTDSSTSCVETVSTGIQKKALDSGSQETLKQKPATPKRERGESCEVFHRVREDRLIPNNLRLEEENEDCCEWLYRMCTDPLSIFADWVNDPVYDKHDMTQTPSCTLPAMVRVMGVQGK